MGSLPSKIIAEKENVDISLTNLEKAMARKEKTVIELAAIATFLHNIYVWSQFISEIKDLF